jgi:hypothetical protein
MNFWQDILLDLRSTNGLGATKYIYIIAKQDMAAADCRFSNCLEDN